MGALYAQTVIEEPGRDGRKFQPGDQVPADLPGIDELKDSGAVGGSKPEVREVASGDGATAGEASG